MNDQTEVLDEDVVEIVERGSPHHGLHHHQYHQYHTFPFCPTTKKRPAPQSTLSLQVYVIPLALVATTFYFFYFRSSRIYYMGMNTDHLFL